MMTAFRRVVDWVGSSVRRNLIITLVVTLVLVSLSFLALFIGFYRVRLADARGVTASEVNNLLQAALENAMLKRDIDGLRTIVARLGKQEGIAGIMILNSHGEVRFASSEKWLSKKYDLSSNALCPDCGPGRIEARTDLIKTTDGVDVLRSVNPVPNRQPCVGCHGAVEANPINGILVIDYAAAGIEREALIIALALCGAGTIVVLTAVGGIGLILRRSVLQPVAALTKASRALSSGDLSQRTDLSGNDELAELGRTFNEMAGQLEHSLTSSKEREEFLQSLIDAIPDGVRMIDQDYNVVMANKEFCQQSELALSDVLAKPCYASSHGRDSPCVPTLVTCPLHEFEHGVPGIVCRHKHVHADGREFYAEVSAAPLRVKTNGGQRLFAVEAIRDLTKDMQVSQQQRLSEIGMLALGVAHAIRNPLSSIHLSLARLDDALKRQRQPKIKEHLQTIDDEIKTCIGVTHRLLLLGEPPSERVELVSLTDIVPDVMSLLSAEAELLRVKVTVALEARLRVLAADNDMRMLVLNIAQNAFHAMPQGGELRITGKIAGSNVELEFYDTGVGIRPEDMHRIFEPFWSRRADGVHGTGLGLAICREIVKRTKGRIEVSTEVGRGTRFRISLPWADSASNSGDLI